MHIGGSAGFGEEILIVVDREFRKKQDENTIIMCVKKGFSDNVGCKARGASKIGIVRGKEVASIRAVREEKGGIADNRKLWGKRSLSTLDTEAKANDLSNSDAMLRNRCPAKRGGI